jgi:hypothetical protein
MRYEVYGVYDPSGTNYGPIAVFRSMRKAITSAQTEVAVNCMFWAVLEKPRRNSLPLSITSGFWGGPPMRITSLIEPSTRYGNPIRDQSKALEYWGWVKKK